jgi:Icc-related predicted phosphoesterase
MKFLAISDTHGKHFPLELPKADCIIHAGDISNTGTLQQVIDFIDWFQYLDYKYKIFIAGNHDFIFEKLTAEHLENLIPENVIYLNDSGVTIEGINIWGSPVSPWFYDWAFNRQRGADIKKHWDLIPANTDILITHGPVFGILDRTTGGQNVGCDDLAMAIKNVKPKVHICGHIHEAFGEIERDGVHYINASILDERYSIKTKGIIFEI